MKRVLMQYFEWYLPSDGSFWRKLAQDAGKLKEMGITDIWMPPAYKGAGGKEDVGYGVYDLYDLGEFHQKGSVATKYGEKEEYLEAVRRLHENGIKVLADIVFNHRMGADECETFEAVRTAEDNRLRHISEGETISAWTKFTCPGRSGKYSNFIWNHTHFTGVDWDEQNKSKGVFRIEGKSWDSEVDAENGNYDYLMGADVDVDNPQVIEELDRFGSWYLNTVGMDGFRLDAVKHMHFSFYTHWLERLRKESGRELFAVGEYWNPDVKALTYFLDKCGQVMSLFDVPLHFHFYQASTGNGNYDMSRILEGTLVGMRPELAVTFVDNHDTQPGQALQSWVLGWFRPLAYALILLREEGTPCVFYGDVYGIEHDAIQAMGGQLDALLEARERYAHGRQTDYFDDFNIVGFTRAGDREHPGSGMAVIMTDGPGGTKDMCVGVEFAGKIFTDCLGNCEGQVVIGENGCGTFRVNGGSVSVWVQQNNK